MMNTLDGVSTPRPKGLTMGYLYYNINRKNDSTEKIDLWCVAIVSCPSFTANGMTTKYKKQVIKSAKKEISMISKQSAKIFEAVISSISDKILAAILKNALCTAKIKSNIHWIYHGRGCLAGRFLLTCFVQAFLPAINHKIFEGV